MTGNIKQHYCNLQYVKKLTNRKEELYHSSNAPASPRTYLATLAPKNILFTASKVARTLREWIKIF